MIPFRNHDTPRNVNCTPSQSRLHPALDGRQFLERSESEYMFVLQGEKTLQSQKNMFTKATAKNNVFTS